MLHVPTLEMDKSIKSRLVGKGKPKSTDKPFAVKDLNRTYPCGDAPARKEIFDQNQQISQYGYSLPDGTVITMDTPALVQAAKIFSSKTSNLRQVLEKPHPQHATVIEVVNEDTLDYANRLQKQDYKVLALDMASGCEAGGGCATGFGNAQEEVIAYRSNLFAPLNKLQTEVEQEKKLDWGTVNPDDYYNYAKKHPNERNLYRKGDFLPMAGGAFLPGVTVFRSWDGIHCKESYQFLQEPFTVDIFATAAFRHVSRKGSDQERWPDLAKPEFYWTMTKEKIRTMCYVAIGGNYDSIVLGAFGNGAFANPIPETLEHVFKPVLREFKGWFKHIGFAVLCPKNSPQFYETYKEGLEHLYDDMSTSGPLQSAL